MDAQERWRRVEQIFHDALLQTPDDRQAFVESSCGDDEELRREVESLLAADSSGDSRISLTGLIATDWAMAMSPAALAGREIGGYRVVSLLGEGGMGEVYLADDLSLGRRVALKLLPQQFTSDPRRLRRFTEEARAASALNHPNIITVHHIGEFDGRRYIVTEFIDGETLRARVTRGPLIDAEAIDITVQAATALRAAHEAGIVHRDIKPENIMIRRDGYVKVLDFGLAKLAGDEQFSDHGTPPQSQAQRTRAGAVLGTPNYMAPEQAKGATVDARADIFSLSVVLHEMITGMLPAEGGGGASPALARILKRGLEPNPDVRYQRIGDLIDDLNALRAPAAEWTARLRRWRMPLSAAAAAIVIAVAGWAALSMRGPLVTSLAVLPLANASGDPDLDYLGEGIAEGVINKLAQLSSLKVIARSTAFQFKDRQGDAAAVGQALNVDAVVTGRVVPQGDASLIEVQLVDARTGATLWTDRYEARSAAAAPVEEEIAQRLVTRLRLPSMQASAPMAAEAHTLYLRGRYQLNKRTPEGLRQARVLFDQAIERDPENALLHAGLADAWLLLGAYSILPPGDTFPRAIAAARRAIERDDSMAEARVTLAFSLFLFEWKWDAAEAEFQRATQMRPGYATGHHWYGEFLMGRGRTDEAVAALRRAKALDPLSLVIAVDEGRAYFFGHRFAEARAQCQSALDASPELVPAIDCLAMVATEEGRYDDAVRGYTEVSRLWGSDSGLPGRTMALARAGRHAEAEALWAQMSAPDRPGYTQPLNLALVQASLGNKDAAFAFLDTARLARANNLAYIKADPRIDSLRGDPRWAAFARQIGLD